MQNANSRIMILGGQEETMIGHCLKKLKFAKGQ
jgi:hypothetical protein